MSFLSKSNLLNKIKTRLNGIKPSPVVADDSKPQTGREITPHLEATNAPAVVYDGTPGLLYYVGKSGLQLIVDEPPRQRSTTASRRMHQLLLDFRRTATMPHVQYAGNRAQRRFNASPTGRKQRAQDLLRSLAGVN